MCERPDKLCRGPHTRYKTNSGKNYTPYSPQPYGVVTSHPLKHTSS